jgi:hypothetical protein
LGIVDKLPPMTDLPKGPFFYLMLGIIFLLKGVVWTFTGEALERFGRVYSRAEQPEAFRESVVADYIIGVALIRVFMYQGWR